MKPLLYAFSFVLLLPPVSTMAVEKLVVLALTLDKAILRIDGARRVLKVGETSPEGVQLISADTDGAVVKVDGDQMSLPLRGVISPIVDSDDPVSVVLFADDSGFFHAEGHINGYSVRFLVDTGAGSVAMSSHMAERLDIDYRNGRPGYAATASGVVKMYAVSLDKVDVGGIVLHHVTAGVLEGRYPDAPLLGMSFLGQVRMIRDGHKMELTKKY
ncbi:MAG TPA: TIGR02281 family clan AA aspartic protease [Acidiferrobacteraceae bacterium]|nr:TIGR02281 family clan AA aspartic protease [Acidiferrobacteraceae bacterium]